MKKPGQQCRPQIIHRSNGPGGEWCVGAKGGKTGQPHRFILRVRRVAQKAGGGIHEAERQISIAHRLGIRQALLIATDTDQWLAMQIG